MSSGAVNALSCLSYTFMNTLAPASISEDMVEMSVSMNPLDVSFTISYVSEGTLTTVVTLQLVQESVFFLLCSVIISQEGVLVSASKL